MINWDELKHFHAVRKLEGILSQWFHTDLLFVDESGEIRNLDYNGKLKEFRNPFAHALLTRDKGREFFLKSIAELSDKIAQDPKARHTVPGPLGFEQLHISNVFLDGDFSGFVLGYCYIESIPNIEQKAVAKRFFEEHGLDPDALEFAFSKLKPLNVNDKKYYSELIDLVAQEVVTFHAEISKREDRISELNNQLGERYSYDQMIGKSKPMQEIYALLDKIKNSSSKGAAWFI